MVINNPVPPAPLDTPEVPELPEKFVLFASEVARRKGVLSLAEAAREFLQSHPDLYLVYVGGVREENGKTISKDILEIVGPELAKRVKFLGTWWACARKCWRA